MVQVHAGAFTHTGQLHLSLAAVATEILNVCIPIYVDALMSKSLHIPFCIWLLFAVMFPETVVSRVATPANSNVLCNRLECFA